MENKRAKKQVKTKRGLWTPEEDLILKKYVETHGEGNWAAVSQKSGLMRGGKSCRLRWKNYLRPNIKRGCMSQDEEDLIIRMHKLIGNRWSLIAGRLPGRTDNEVKNYWNTHLNKKLCRLGKRKIIDELGSSHTHQQGDTVNNNSSSNKLRRCCDSQPIGTATTEDLDVNGGRKIEEEEEKTMSVSDGNWTWIEEEFLGGVVPPVTSNATFVFDDEPFITYLDSFLLFEAFECSSELEMQSIMHGPSSI